jgi:hypothetical protein
MNGAPGTGFGEMIEEPTQCAEEICGEAARDLAHIIAKIDRLVSASAVATQQQFDSSTRARPFS